uniref:Uncharacterized protein n=1 Tax=Spongospora subterranea TaxID=70186 RepID=A0A0H5RRZ9_9EUKA|eukprot:CRZ11499.1 hypothetical protein [Spongospora subterranea]
MPVVGDLMCRELNRSEPVPAWLCRIHMSQYRFLRDRLNNSKRAIFLAIIFISIHIVIFIPFVFIPMSPDTCLIFLMSSFLFSSFILFPTGVCDFIMPNQPLSPLNSWPFPIILTMVLLASYSFSQSSLLFPILAGWVASSVICCFTQTASWSRRFKCAITMHAFAIACMAPLAITLIMVQRPFKSALIQALIIMGSLILTFAIRQIFLCILSNDEAGNTHVIVAFCCVFDTSSDFWLQLSLPQIHSLTPLISAMVTHNMLLILSFLSSTRSSIQRYEIRPEQIPDQRSDEPRKGDELIALNISGRILAQVNATTMFLVIVVAARFGANRSYLPFIGPTFDSWSTISASLGLTVYSIIALMAMQIFSETPTIGAMSQHAYNYAYHNKSAIVTCVGSVWTIMTFAVTIFVKQSNVLYKLYPQS